MSTVLLKIKFLYYIFFKRFFLDVNPFIVYFKSYDIIKTPGKRGGASPEKPGGFPVVRPSKSRAQTDSTEFPISRLLVRVSFSPSVREPIKYLVIE